MIYGYFNPMPGLSLVLAYPPFLEIDFFRTKRNYIRQSQTRINRDQAYTSILRLSVICDSQYIRFFKDHAFIEFLRLVSPLHQWEFLRRRQFKFLASQLQDVLQYSQFLFQRTWFRSWFLPMELILNHHVLVDFSQAFASKLLKQYCVDKFQLKVLKLFEQLFFFLIIFFIIN